MSTVPLGLAVCNDIYRHAKALYDARIDALPEPISDKARAEWEQLHAERNLFAANISTWLEGGGTLYRALCEWPLLWYVLPERYQQLHNRGRARPFKIEDYIAADNTDPVLQRLTRLVLTARMFQAIGL